MSFWRSQTIRHTRKRHTCAYCGAIIPIGSTCDYEVGISDMDFNSYYLCERCVVFISVFKDQSDCELGDFFDELQATDLMECPKCHCSNHRDIVWGAFEQSVDLTCDRCEHSWILDLSVEAINKLK